MNKVFVEMKARVAAFIDKEKALEGLVGGLATSEVMGQRSVGLRARLQETVNQAGNTPNVRDWLVPQAARTLGAPTPGYTTPGDVGAPAVDANAMVQAYGVVAEFATATAEQELNDIATSLPTQAKLQKALEATKKTRDELVKALEDYEDDCKAALKLDSKSGSGQLAAKRQVAADDFDDRLVAIEEIVQTVSMYRELVDKMRKQRRVTTESKDVKDLQDRLEAAKKDIEDLTEQAGSLYGTVRSRSRESKVVTVTCPNDLMEGHGNAMLLERNVRAWLPKVIKQYWLVAMFIYKMFDTYNEVDGTYYCPPKRADNWKTSDGTRTSTLLRAEYALQTQELWNEMEASFPEEVMAATVVPYMGGTNGNIEMVGESGNGVLALWMLLQRFRPSSDEYQEEIRSMMNEAFIDFRSGDPNGHLDRLTPHLQEAIRIGCHIPWGSTGKKIIDTLMAKKDSHYGHYIHKYRDTCKCPEDCAVYLLELFAKIRVAAKADPAASLTANSVQTDNDSVEQLVWRMVDRRRLERGVRARCSVRR